MTVRNLTTEEATALATDLGPAATELLTLTGALEHLANPAAVDIYGGEAVPVEPGEGWCRYCDAAMGRHQDRCPATQPESEINFAAVALDQTRRALHWKAAVRELLKHHHREVCPFTSCTDPFTCTTVADAVSLVVDVAGDIP